MLRNKYKKQIAAEYDVHAKTLQSWLAKAGVTIPRGLLSPSKQKVIYERFGYPVLVKYDSSV